MTLTKGVRSTPQRRARVESGVDRDPRQTNDRRPMVRGLDNSNQFEQRVRPGTDGKTVGAAVPANVDLHADQVKGNLADDNIPGLGAGKISSGTFVDARIPNLGAGKITSGAFDFDRIPGLSNRTEDDKRAASKEDLKDKLNTATFSGHKHSFTDDINDVPKSADQDKESLRKIAGKGQNKTAAASDHNHSISFKGLPRETRRNLLRARSAVRAGLAADDYGETGPLRALAALTLAVSTLAFDDPDRTAEEWMAVFDADSDAEDRYLDHSIPGYARRRAEGTLDRFYAEQHPDLYGVSA